MLSDMVQVIQTAKLELPAFELAALLVIMAAALVFRYHRVGLIAAYILVYRWGWMVFGDFSEQTLVCYLVFGILIGVLSVISMLRAPT